MKSKPRMSHELDIGITSNNLDHRKNYKLTDLFSSKSDLFSIKLLPVHLKHCSSC